MGVLVLASPGGSPGVTTTALALALMWPRPVILAECDPAGGSVISGLWRGESDAGEAAGRLQAALAAERDTAMAAKALEVETLFLGGEAEAMLLPALPGPGAGRRLAGSWPKIATAFALAERDIIADVGRFDNTAGLGPLLSAASRVLLVCQPTLRQAAAAEPRLKLLSRTHPTDGIVLINRGECSPDAFARKLGVSLAGTLPWTPAAARVLSDGARHGRWFIRSRLMRAARALAEQLAHELDTQPGSTLPEEACQQ